MRLYTADVFPYMCLWRIGCALHCRCWWRVGLGKTRSQNQGCLAWKTSQTCNTIKRHRHFFKWTLKTSWTVCESTSPWLTKQLKHRGNGLGCPTPQEQCPDGRDSWPEAPRFYWSAHTVESSDLRNTALWMKTWFHISLIQIYTQSRSHIAF